MTDTTIDLFSALLGISVLLVMLAIGFRLRHYARQCGPLPVRLLMSVSMIAAMLSALAVLHLVASFFIPETAMSYPSLLKNRHGYITLITVGIPVAILTYGFAGRMLRRRSSEGGR